MSISETKEQISNFLHSNEPGVLVIKGRWGTGKTFIWNKCFEEEAKQKKILLSKYSYVSLFGVKSIDDIKDKISDSLRYVVQISTESRITILSNMLDKCVRKSSSWIANVFDSILNYYNIKMRTLPALKKILFSSVEESIIVLDDFERKNSALFPDEILGLISELKEQRKCKIVLIFNDEGMIEDEKKEYEKLREKVVDEEPYFWPTPEECAKIVFSNNSPGNILAKLSIQLKIRNIRILYRINRLSNSLEQILNNYHDDIKYQAIHSLVLFVYCYFSPQPELPTIESLKTLSLGYLYKSTDKDSKANDNWIDVLESYGYKQTDDIDRCILEGIIRGYFNAKEIIFCANQLTSEFEKYQAKREFEKSWDIFYDSLDNNQNEVVDSIYNSFKTNLKYLTIKDLNSTLIIFRALGEENKPDELLELYFETNKDKLENLDFNGLIGFQKKERDSKLLTRLKELQNTNKKQLSLENTFQKIISTNSWDEEDKEIIQTASEDDLSNLLRKSSGKDRHEIIKHGKYFIPESIKKVLSSISKESKINELRLRSYLE